MGRRKGSRNRPKESNGVGHNSGEAAPMSTGDTPLGMLSAGELTDDEKQEIYFARKRRIVALKDEVAALNLEMRGEYKDLKLKLGLLRAEVDYGIMLDDEDAEKKHARRMMIRRWEHPGEQAEMFGDGIDRTPAVDKAYALGKKHGLAGDPCNPECDPSTPQYQSYMTGFHEGNAVLARGIKRLVTPPVDPPPMDLPHGSEPPADGNPRMSRAEWKAHLAKQNAEVAAEIKAGIGTEPATASPGE